MDSDAELWAHCLDYDSASELGLRRANNQDAKAVVLAGSQDEFARRGHLFLVADGMGAHAAGELASKIAADVVPLTYHKLRDRSPTEALVAAIQDANGQIHTRGQASEDFRGMGTTVSVLALLPEGAVLAHAGDSRVYRLRGTRFEQLTFDHSLTWEIQRAGQGKLDETAANVPKNIITRSLGPKPAVEVDLEGPFRVEVGDTFLLCSDGLSGQVSNEEMGAILHCLSPKEAIRVLVDLANLRGGPDNITVIVVRVTGPLAISGGEAPHPETDASRPQPVHPLVWTLLGVFALGALMLFALDYSPAALVSLGGAIIAGVIALVQRYADTSSGYRLDGRPLGRGPYVAVDCPPNADIVGRLGEVAQKLRDAAANGHWTVGWDPFNALEQQAQDAARRGDFDRAVREYGQAIWYMMDQLRGQRERRGQGSTSGLF